MSDTEPEVDRKRCVDAAFRLLAAREHSLFEMKQKLVAKGLPSEVVENLLAELVQDGLQSDSRFAEAFVRSRAGKGQGPERIRMELQQRGVASELISQAFAESEADWFTLAAEVRARKFGQSLPVDWKEKAKQGRFLQYRGFSSEQVRHALAADD